MGAQRNPVHYLVQVLLVVFLLVAASFSVVGVPVGDVADRCSITLTLALTVVAFMSYIQSWCPPTPYLTLLDIYILGSLLVICVVMIENFIIARIAVDWKIGQYEVGDDDDAEDRGRLAAKFDTKFFFYAAVVWTTLHSTLLFLLPLRYLLRWVSRKCEWDWDVRIFARSWRSVLADEEAEVHIDRVVVDHRQCIDFFWEDAGERALEDFLSRDTYFSQKKFRERKGMKKLLEFFAKEEKKKSCWNSCSSPAAEASVESTRRRERNNYFVQELEVARFKQDQILLEDKYRPRPGLNSVKKISHKARMSTKDLEVQKSVDC